MNEKAKGSGGGSPRDGEPSAAAEWTARPCPICGKPGVFEMRPFCSKRCADVDLHRWLGGTYAIPVNDDTEDAKEPGDESRDG